MGQKAGTMATSLAGGPPPPPPPQQQQTFKLLWKNSFDKIREKSAAAAGDDDDAFSFRVPEAGALMYRVVAWKKCLTKCKSFSALKKSEGDALEFLTDAWLESALGLPSGAITKIAKKAIGEGLGFLSMTFRLTVAYSADLPHTQSAELLRAVLRGHRRRNRLLPQRARFLHRNRAHDRQGSLRNEGAQGTSPSSLTMAS